ncbi:RnfABCDGE type electron transport complex subunit D [Crocosphaera sp. XPORK-15E]|uniref:RnfABCDGE type electron transport complex subunit D n=1 Tax=Crocosphaera sp. XPORK-15E TaxID=3110247 RepID=UPI002B208576|nr:RnfABCDGE type electron transport complex subunit D [Crocosphaera sp. XPORK-15E]MEA5534969.1 RnfABCDGE type electron transport complex subunit D [Crocosphaera sp. XPORK-15E]
MILKDDRDYQILFLSSFLFLGILTRDWTLKPDLIIVIILTCLLTQWVLTSFVSWQNTPNHPQPWFNSLINPLFIASWRSALITALGLCLLLRANHYTTMIIAASLAIASKFLFRVNNKHFFNPANFGIIATLILTQDAWVSPGQWGDDWWYLVLFLGTGGIILKRVGRWETSAVFLGTYTLLETVRNVWLGWSGDVLIHHLMSGSLLLFALFMLTDPRSIPNHHLSRLGWAVAIAILTFILQHFWYLSTAIFWALFLLSPFTILLDYCWTAPKFSWSINLQIINFEKTS